MGNKKTKFNDKAGIKTIDFSAHYDNHPDYLARRINGSFEQEKIAIEVTKFKVPNLLWLLPQGWIPEDVLEIGCATGELISSFPVVKGGNRVGIDISSSNISTANNRFPETTFIKGNFTELPLPIFDCVILSDILEHIEDDVRFLSNAADFGRYILVNLPLEDNWLNCNRNYGVNDVSGHLRKYSLERGLDLFHRADLDVIRYQRIWVHESTILAEIRHLRRRHYGREYNGRSYIQLLKKIVMKIACAITPIGRHLFASNLFVIAKNKHTHP